MTLRRRTRLLFVLVSLVLAGAAVVAGNEPTPAVPKPGAPSTLTPPAPGAAVHVVRVYYFRTTTRCASCRKIEAFTDAAVKKAFAQEMENGTLIWQTINVQEPGNGHYIQDYKLAAKSVVVVDVMDGRQARWKNLNRIWELLSDEPMFARYIEEEVKQYLGGRS